AAGGRQDRDAHAAEDVGHLVLADVHPPPGARDAHDTRDRLLAARAILQVHAERPLLLVLDEAEVLHEPLLLEDLGDPDLEPRGGDVDLLVLGPTGVADAGQQVGDRIAHHDRPPLPARLDDTRDLALQGQLPEADPARLELPQVSPGPATELAPVIGARLELRRCVLLHDQRRLGHRHDSRNGKPTWVSNAFASSSVCAVVTIVMSMPRTLSTLSYTISGKITCSRSPML